MMSNSLNEEFPQEMVFIKESVKEQILMSDEQEVFCFYSTKHAGSNKPTIFFIQGLGPGVYSWSDLWDELYKDYDLVIIDSREKPSINLKKKKHCTVQRIALDIVETIHYLKLKEENVIFIGSSFGVYYVAHCVSQKWVMPKNCFFIGPFVRTSYPNLSTQLAFMLPTSLLEKVGKRIARRYLRTRVAAGFQKKVYYERVTNIDVGRWKRCSKMRRWNASEDYKRIKCPIFIFTTSDDKYHRIEKTREVCNLIENSTLIEIPDYNFMHIKPGVVEFAKMINKHIHTIDE
ncbi:MAG: alpha/beta hydrolase [Candidatus Heimdallarchaeota archaeon]|nr:alpha/beta hydrolase [Candidatus Heimdallarchaeota archaeon]